MTKVDKYKNCFVEGLSAEISQITDDLEYNGIPEWDSIGHMSLISSLEETFDIQIETDDVIDFSSFQKGKEIISKYGVKID